MKTIIVANTLYRSRIIGKILNIPRNMCHSKNQELSGMSVDNVITYKLKQEEMRELIPLVLEKDGRVFRLQSFHLVPTDKHDD